MARHLFCVPGESYIAALDALHDRPIAVTVCRQKGGASMMAEAAGKAPAGRASASSRAGRAPPGLASTDRALCRASQATLDQGRACNGALVDIDSTRHHGALSTRSRRSCHFPSRACSEHQGQCPTSIGGRKGILRLNCEQKRKPSGLVFRQQSCLPRLALETAQRISSSWRFSSPACVATRTLRLVKHLDLRRVPQPVPTDRPSGSAGFYVVCVVDKAVWPGGD